MSQENIVSLSNQGELLVNLQAGYNTQFKISSWVDGLNFFSFEQGEWSLESIDAGLILATISAEKNIVSGDATEMFVKHIPLNLRKVLAAYHYKQFSLLRLVAQYPELEDIIMHSPNLCWLLVVFAEKQEWPINKVAQTLLRKRIHITAILFGLKSSQLVKLINKVQLINGSEGEFKFLLKILSQEDIVNAFKHWLTVPMQALKMIEFNPCFLNTQLLINEIDSDKSTVSNSLKFSKIKATYDDLLRLNACLQNVFEERSWRSIKTELQLTLIHDRLAQRYNNTEAGRLAQIDALREQGITEKNDEPYPISPLGDFEYFIQIKDRNELAAEGIFMQHCVSSYHNALHNGSRYIYKLLKPQRATVELHVSDKSFKVIQFKLAKNRKPDPESYQYVRKLLDNLSFTTS